MIAKSGKTQLSAQDLALLGAGKVGYIRKMRSEDVLAKFPEAPELDPGLSCGPCSVPTAHQSC
jgi:hypothetical protein